MLAYYVIPMYCLGAFLFVGYYLNSLPETIPLTNRLSIKQNLEKKFFIFIAIYMIALCGLRSYSALHHIGIDTHAYYLSYLSKQHFSLHNILTSDFNDKGYVILQRIFGKLDLKFWMLLLFNAIIYVGSVTWYIYKFSKNKWLSLFIFLAMGLYTFAFSAVRQSIAMGFCLIAFLLSNKISGWKSFLLFVFFTFIASTIHASAVIFFPMYFLQKLEYKTITVWLLLGVSALTMLFKTQFANLILTLAAEASDKYEGYEILEGSNAGILLYLLILAFIVLKLLEPGQKLSTKKDSSIYFLLFMLILFPATQTGGAMMRIYYYYYIFIVVYIPNALANIRDYKIRFLAYLFINAFLLYFYLSGDPQQLMLSPYYFFWQR